MSSRMPATFGTVLLSHNSRIQTSPCFEGSCDCPRILGMEKQSPTPPLSGPGSSVLTACDQELTSPADFSPLWTTSNGRAFETEHSHRFAADLQRALHNVDLYPRPLEEDLQQYIAVHETQPSYYEISPPQFFQYPPYQQEPSYMDYQSHPFSSLSPALTTMSESPAMNQLYRTYVWPAPQELRGPSDERRGDTYFAMSPEEEEDDDLCDKPYARLIYDALMQAPGHRMMLRDIYDWFQRHTTKPAESGTNGWQNSIRHNLSMNQVSPYGKLGLILADTVTRPSRTTNQTRPMPLVRNQRSIACGC